MTLDARTRVRDGHAGQPGTSLGGVDLPFGDVADVAGAYVTVTSMGTGLLSLGSATAALDAGRMRRRRGDEIDLAPLFAEGAAAPSRPPASRSSARREALQVACGERLSSSWLGSRVLDSRILVATNIAHVEAHRLVRRSTSAWSRRGARRQLRAATSSATSSTRTSRSHGDNAFFAAEIVDPG